MSDIVSAFRKMSSASDPFGKSLTNTVTGKNAQGQTVNNTVLYDKQ